MSSYENNAYFWQKVDTLFLSSNLKITNKKDEVHRQFSNLIYPIDHGYLLDAGEEGDQQISVYVGSQSQTVSALIIAADILQKTLEVKMLVGCSEEEIEAVLRFLNQTDYQKTVLIRRGNEMPSWAITDN